MFYLEDTKNEIMKVTNPAYTLSLDCSLPDFRKGMICIPSVTLDAGRCFFVRNIVSGLFSFTDRSESIIKTLCLTIRDTAKIVRRKVKRAISYIYERAKHVVCPTAPRFMRL